MAKSILFSSPAYTAWIKRNTLDDLVDMKRFGDSVTGSKIVSWRKLFGSFSQKEGHNKAKGLVRRMFELMAHDMLFNHDTFVLPEKDFGFMRIASMNHRVDVSHRPFNIDTENIHFGGVIVLQRDVQRSIGNKMYFFKLTQPWLEKLRELTSNGHRWQ
jgi:hypothetical protein